MMLQFPPARNQYGAQLELRACVYAYERGP